MYILASFGSTRISKVVDKKYIYNEFHALEYFVSGREKNIKKRGLQGISPVKGEFESHTQRFSITPARGFFHDTFVGDIGDFLKFFYCFPPFFISLEFSEGFEKSCKA